jgi:hypothetical protein
MTMLTSAKKRVVQYIIAFSILIFSLLEPPAGMALEPAHPEDAQMSLTLIIHQIKIKDVHEFLDDEGEFYFVRTINGNEARYPATGKVNKKKNQLIQPGSSSNENPAFWSITTSINNVNATEIRIRGYEVDDLQNDNLSTVTFSIDLSTFQFIEEYTNRTIDASDYSMVVSAFTAPVVSSLSHPDTTQEYHNSAIALEWQPCKPGCGLLGYSYLMDQECCTVPDDQVEGTHTSVNYRNQPDGIYWFHVRVMDKMGYWSATSHFLIKINTGTAVEIEDRDVQIRHFSVEQNYPNPFNSNTRIDFKLEQPGHVTGTIYNMRGQQITTLTNTSYEAGRYSLIWDGTNNFEQALPSGVYFCRLIIDRDVRTIRMTLSR